MKDRILQTNETRRNYNYTIDWNWISKIFKNWTIGQLLSWKMWNGIKLKKLDNEMNSTKLKRPILDLEKWRVYMDGAFYLSMTCWWKKSLHKGHSFYIFKFQCFFFWQICALWQQKEASYTMDFSFFWENWL